MVSRGSHLFHTLCLMSETKHKMMIIFVMWLGRWQSGMHRVKKFHRKKKILRIYLHSAVDRLILILIFSLNTKYLWQLSCDSGQVNDHKWCFLCFIVHAALAHCLCWHCCKYNSPCVVLYWSNNFLCHPPPQAQFVVITALPPHTTIPLWPGLPD